VSREFFYFRILGGVVSLSERLVGRDYRFLAQDGLISSFR